MAFSRIEKQHCGICPDAVGNLEQKTTTSFVTTQPLRTDYRCACRTTESDG